MITRKVALIIFYDDKKRILLQDRRGISKLEEEWGFFGGGIEREETPEQAVLREVKEELDFNLQNYRFIGVDESQIGDRVIERHSFIAPIENNFTKLRQIEGLAMEFFSLSKARKLKMVPGDELVLKRLEKSLAVTKT